MMLDLLKVWVSHFETMMCEYYGLANLELILDLQLLHLGRFELNI